MSDARESHRWPQSLARRPQRCPLCGAPRYTVDPDWRINQWDYTIHECGGAWSSRRGDGRWYMAEPCGDAMYAAMLLMRGCKYTPPYKTEEGK